MSQAKQNILSAQGDGEDGSISSEASHDHENPIKLLLVEDDAETRDIWGKILRHLHSYNILEAGDGCEAFDMAQQQSPDIILMDLDMPICDGYEAMRLLKTTPTTHHIPIIVLSDYSWAEEHYDRAMKAGCVACIEKGGDFSVVDRLIHATLENSRRDST